MNLTFPVNSFMTITTAALLATVAYAVKNSVSAEHMNEPIREEIVLEKSV
jgi:hypothetical protein